MRRHRREGWHHGQHLQHVQGRGAGGAGGAHAAGHVPASGHLPNLRRHRRAVYTMRHVPGRRARAVSLAGNVRTVLFQLTEGSSQCFFACSPSSSSVTCWPLLCATCAAVAASASRCACRKAWTRAAGCVCGARAMRGGGELSAAPRCSPTSNLLAVAAARFAMPHSLPPLQQ